MLDYPTLRIIWWILLGVLLIGFAVVDGVELGISMLLHYVARNNDERQVTVNTIGSVWIGNQIWLAFGVCAIFAAWPSLYAVLFSKFYLAMLALIVVSAALIIQLIGFKYRSKIENSNWRTIWDIALFITGFVPAFVFGVTLGNVLQGIPFYFDPMMRAFYSGTLLGLFTPFALWCGLVSIFMLLMHGGVFLSIKTTGVIQMRAVSAATISGIITLILFAIAGFWVVYYLHGYILTSPIVLNGPSNPLYKHAIAQIGTWNNNFKTYPGLLAVEICGFGGIVFSIIFLSIQRMRIARIASAIGIAGIISTLGVSMFPFILPSSTNPNMSLTVWDASSSQLTLFVMLTATAIFLPIILLYTTRVYRVMCGKVTGD